MNALRFLRENAPWLAAGMLMTFSSGYGQTFFIAVFSGEIRAEFGLSHTAWGAIYTLGTAASALAMVFAGGLADRFRARGLGVASLGWLVLACLAMAALPGAWALPFVIFALRFGGQGMISHVGQVAMARWFKATRGRALGIASLGFSLSEAILPLAFVAMLAVAPWRSLWVVAALMAAAAIPLLMVLLRRERSPMGADPAEHAEGALGGHWTRGRAMRHWLFWMLVPALLGPPAFITVFFFQQVHLAEVKGWAHVELVALFPVYTLSGVGAMLLGGALVDRLGATRLMPFAQVPLVLAFAVFALAPTPLLAALGMIAMGLTQGLNNSLLSAFWAEVYGTRHIGSVKALAAAIMVLGSAIGPGVTGVLIDAGLGFETQLGLMSGWFAGASVLTGLAVLRVLAEMRAVTPASEPRP